MKNHYYYVLFVHNNTTLNEQTEIIIICILCLLDLHSPKIVQLAERCCMPFDLMEE